MTLGAMEECYGIAKGCRAEWMLDQTRLTVGSVPCGPHRYEFTMDPESNQLAYQQLAIDKIVSMLRHVPSDGLRWTAQADWFGTPTTMREREWLECVSRDLRHDRAATALLAFGQRRIKDDDDGVPGMLNQTERSPGIHYKIVNYNVFAERLSWTNQLSPMLDLLLESLYGCGEQAAEAFAAVDPDRGDSLTLLQWFRKEHQDDELTHEQVYERFLEMRGWVRSPAQKRLPKYSTDPVHPFLSRYCRKLGQPRSKSPWVLRESAKR